MASIAQSSDPVSGSKTKKRHSIDFNRLGGMLTVVVLIGLVGFLAFVAGGVGTVMNVPPISDFMRKATMAILSAYRTGVGGQIDQFWYPERLPLTESGDPIVIHDPAAAWPGPHRKTINTISHVALMPDLVRIDPASLNFLEQTARRTDAGRRKTSRSESSRCGIRLNAIFTTTVYRPRLTKVRIYPGRQRAYTHTAMLLLEALRIDRAKPSRF